MWGFKKCLDKVIGVRIYEGAWLIIFENLSGEDPKQRRLISHL
jgi:hypothetical protein